MQCRERGSSETGRHIQNPRNAKTEKRRDKHADLEELEDLQRQSRTERETETAEREVHHTQVKGEHCGGNTRVCTHAHTDYRRARESESMCTHVHTCAVPITKETYSCSDVPMAKFLRRAGSKHRQVKQWD